MSSRQISGTLLFSFALLLIGAFGCNSNDVTSPPAGGGGSSNLVQSASNPANGDGTLTAAATLAVNSGGTGYDEANISQMLGIVGHDLVVTWDTNTHVLNGVNNGWFDGTSGGNTLCLASGTPCDPAKVSIDFAAHTVTFTGLVLPDTFGGTSTSTLTGTMSW
jgi:hypothetical protein